MPLIDFSEISSLYFSQAGNSVKIHSFDDRIILFTECFCQGTIARLTFRVSVDQPQQGLAEGLINHVVSSLRRLTSFKGPRPGRWLPVAAVSLNLCYIKILFCSLQHVLVGP